MPSTSVSRLSWVASMGRRLHQRPDGGINGRRGVQHRLASEDRPLQASTIRIGTRGSPLALAQAREVQRAPGGRARAGTMGVRGARHQDLGRPHPGPPARRSRRQGPLHQGDRGGAAGRRHRPRRALHEGHADAAAGGLDGQLLPAARGRARRLHQQQGRHARPAARRERWSAPPRCGARPRSSTCGPTSPSCPCAATSRQGCASFRTAPPMRRCSPAPA